MPVFPPARQHARPRTQALVAGISAGICLSVLSFHLARPAFGGASFRSYRFEVSGRAVQIPSMVVEGEVAAGGTEAAADPDTSKGIGTGSGRSSGMGGGAGGSAGAGSGSGSGRGLGTRRAMRTQEFISLKGAAAALGGTVSRRSETGEFHMSLAGTEIRFSPEYPSLVTAGGHIVSLDGDARIVLGDLYLPIDFLTRVVEPVLSASREQRAMGPLPTAWSESGLGGASGASGARGASGATGGSGAVGASGANGARGAIGASGAGGASVATFPASTRGGIGGARENVMTVVLDPGHGGDENGAEGKTGALEKEITLDVARRLKKLLEKDSGINILLTRDSDAVVALDERTALANHNHADLFVSIHVNSAPRKDARGAETYFLASQSKDRDIRTLAAIENNASGVDPADLGADSGGLELVLWDLAQSTYLEESSILAEAIQRELNDALGIKDRGVKQAPFRVLMGATMPAVLVEVGFISNPAEETNLKTDEYRDKIAGALAIAVRAFRSEARAHASGASVR